MKFLVLQRDKAGAMPMENWAEVLRSTKAFVESGLAEGWIESTYSFAGMGGAAIIVEFDSHEEVWDRMLAYPLGLINTFEVIPLIDSIYALDTMIQQAEMFELA